MSSTGEPGASAEAEEADAMERAGEEELGGVVLAMLRARMWRCVEVEKWIRK